MGYDLPKRKRIRLKNYDYSSAGAYFLTICTRNRQCVLSRIVGAGVPDCPKTDSTPSQTVGAGVPDRPKTDFTPSQTVGAGVPDCPLIELKPYGKTAEKYINHMNDFYENIFVERFVIMPNHIHLLLFVKENGQPRTAVPTKGNSTVSRFVSTFKRFCNKEYGENIWQDRFYDHIIRNREDLDNHIKYIDENPIRWYFDELYTEE